MASAETAWTRACTAGERLSIPVKHTTGRYYAPEPVLDELEANGQVAFRYAPGENPNGSARDIAGVSNAAGNVVGLMPHPEHAVDPLTGSAGRAQAVRTPSRPRSYDRGRAAPPRARSDRPRVRADRRAHGARAQRGRARGLLADVVRALRLQALQAAAALAADRGRARGHGPGRERRRGLARRRPGVRVQGRVPQPPERGRAVPGRGHRRRRHPARRLRDRRAADRDPRLAALRRVRALRALALPARARGGGHRPLRQLDRRRRRSAARSTSRTPTSRTASSTRCASG